MSGREIELGSAGWKVVVAVGLVGVWGWMTLGIAADVSSVMALVKILIVALPVVVGLWVAAWGYGGLWKLQGVARLAAGMGGLLLAIYVAAWMGGLNGVAGWGLCAVGWVLGGFQLFQLRKTAGDGGANRGFAALGPRLKKWCEELGWGWLMWVPGVVMLVVAACCPPGTLWKVEAFGYDVLTYHLQIPREWVAAGGMVELEHNVYGYLPGLMETVYAMIGAMRGGDVVGSAYACQIFHATFALLAAAGVGGLVKQVACRANIAAAAGGVYLAVPWVLITGASAYNEQAAVAFGIAAMTMALKQSSWTRREALAMGLMLGAATLCKLTAGFAIALPVGMVVVVRALMAMRVQKESRSAGWRSLGWCVLAGCVVLSPYLMRNAAWTGNPVFPFATQVLGAGHWEDEQVERWNAGHHPAMTLGERWDSAWRNALTNRGYASVGGGAIEGRSTEVARFSKEGGLPLLWLTAAVGAALAMRRRALRWPAIALVAWVVWQGVWWFFFTHVQSRFMVTAVPASVALIGLGVASFLSQRKSEDEADATKKVSLVISQIALAVMVLVFALVSWATLQRQTVTFTVEGGGRVQAPLWVLIDGMPEPWGTGLMGGSPINDLPADSRVLLIADNGSLLYLTRPVGYASAFDVSPISRIFAELPEASRDSPADFADAIKQQGYSHVWVGYSEIDRLAATYGVDAGVTSENLRHLTRSWPALSPPQGPAVLYKVP